MSTANPRFRQDLLASAIETDGVACVDVRDPRSGSSFRFYDFEYQLALQMNGQPLDAIVAWAAATYGLDLTADGVAEFAARLAELGFLETAPVPAAPPPGAAAAAGGVQGAVPGAAPSEALGSAEAEWLALQSAKTTQFVPDAGMLTQSAQDLTPVFQGATGNGTAASPSAAAAASAAPASAASPSAAPPVAPPPREATPGPATLFGYAPASPVAAPSVETSGPSGVTELPSDALDEAPDSGPAAARPDVGRTERTAGPGWAWEIDATLKGVPQPPDPTPRPDADDARAARADVGGNGAGRSEEDATALPATSEGARAGAADQAPPEAAAPPSGMRERRQPPAPDAVVMTPFQEDGSRQFRAQGPKRVGRPGPIIAVVLLLVAGAAVGGFFYWKKQNPAAPVATKVRVVAPQPTAVYRWFSTSGTVVDLSVRTLSFGAPGKVAELLPAGSAFAAGDILGKLQGAPALEAELGRYKSRLAFYEQVRDSMKATNNQPELRQAELKLAEKQKLINDTQAALNKLLLRAPEPGEISETLVKVGAQVTPKAPALKWKGKLLHGDFTMDAADFAAANALAFCRVEVSPLAPGAAADAAPAAEPAAGARFMDCKLPQALAGEPPPTDRTDSPLRKFVVGLPPDAGLVSGQPLRLAKLRHDAVFPLPPSAVVHGDAGDKVWVVTPAGAAELRPVTIVDTREQALVSKGLSVGDQVIVEPPADLQEGATVSAEPAESAQAGAASAAPSAP